MSILQCILLKLLAGRHYSDKNMRGCRQRQKHQRSEPSIHFLIYAVNEHENICIAGLNYRAGYATANHHCSED
jgi:hypothetical protein